MDLIRPFTGLRPLPEQAAAVIAPPYDVVNAVEAQARAAGRPWSFLHISRAEIDLPEGTDPHAPEVYAKAAQNLERMVAEGILHRDTQPRFCAYRLTRGAQVQTGLVAVASVAAYESGRIRRHEFTRPDKEDDRVRQIEALHTQTGPVLLTYRQDAAVAELLATVAAGAPEFEVSADDGVVHTLWVIRDPGVTAALSSAFEAMQSLYIADGHHRSAAAARVAANRKAANPAHTGEESYNYFLAVLFPHDQMNILDYNRVVRDLNGMRPETFLDSLAAEFRVEPEPEPVRPSARGEFGLYLAARWYRLTLDPACIPAADPVGRLDVSLLTDRVLEPLLGIVDLRRDPRIDFVGGSRGLEGLMARVDSGEMAAAFSLYPTSMEDLMAVADSGRVMPPKSTWFEPKLADGLVSHVLD